MPLPFQSDLDRQRGMLDELDQARSPAISPSIQDAIIGVESGGDPAAIGDVGAKAGSSRGAMQIQAQTARDLYKQGKLPKEWNGKKVKRNRLPDLLLDPEFNKMAGSALYEDNRNIIKRKAIQKGIDLTDAQLEDLVIKAHNQGVTRTIKRDLLGEEPVNPKVQKYLEKVRGRIVPPSEFPEFDIKPFEDGGVIHAEDGWPPTSLLPEELREEEYPMGSFQYDDPDVMATPDLYSEDEMFGVEGSPEPYEEPEPDVEPEESQLDLYKEMMADYEKRKEQYRKDKNEAAIGDFASRIATSVGQYGVSKGAAEAQKSSGMKLKGRDLGLKGTELVKGLKAPDLKEYIQKAKLMKDLRALKGGGKNIKGTYQTYTAQEGKHKGKQVKQLMNPYTNQSMGKQMLVETPKKGYSLDGIRYNANHTIVNRGNYSDDPNDRYNIALSNKLTELGISVPESFIASKKWENLANKAQTTKYQTDRLKTKDAREKRLVEKQKFTITEKGIDRKQKISDTFNKDKSVMTATEALNKGKRVREFIKADSKLAPAFVTRALARMAGEVGVMTDKDVAAFRGSPAWTDQLEQLWQQGTKGTLTETNKAVLIEAVDILEKAERGVIQERAMHLSGQFAQFNPELSGQQIYNLMIPPPIHLDGDAPQRQTGTYSSSQLKKAADKSFGGDLKKAEAFYKSKGFKAQ